MEGKEKIVLKDGTVLAIENGACENCIQMTIQDLDELKGLDAKFTDENLESYTIQNAAGLTCATHENKHLVSELVEHVKDGIKISFNLADVDMVEKRLNALEAAQEGINSEQAIQDGAIADLGEIVGGMMEGGEM